MMKLHEQNLTKKDPALHSIQAGKVQKKNNKQKKPQLAARGQNQGKGKNKLAYAPKPKIPPPPKRENPAKDSVCHQCGDTGIFTIELYTFPNKSWVYDTGCGTHICNTTQGLRGSRKLKPGALSLYVGNGQRAAVEAIGSYHLCLPSGLVIVLNNYHYAPSITRGITSVSCLYDDVFINCFVDNAILVSRNNVVYVSAIPRDGIFEFDLSNPNTNDSSMYDVSNKRAKPDKLEPRSIKCIFNSFINQEASGNLEDLEIIHEEDTHPSKNTSSHHEEDDLEIDEPLSDVNPIRRSTRTRNALNHMCLYIDAEEHELEDLGEPANNKYEFCTTPLKLSSSDGHSLKTYSHSRPEGFVNPKYLNRVCKLKHFIYGLKQASRQWNKRFDDEIKKFSFTQNQDEPCVYMKASGSNVTFLILYVDDILIMGNHIPMLQGVKSYLGKCFAMKDLREATYIIGIKIYRDKSRRLISLCQSAYIEKIIKRYHMENSKRGSILMQKKLKLSKSQGDLHWTIVRNILKYLQNTKDMFLVYGGDMKRELRVFCYTDAGYLTDADRFKWRNIVPIIKEPVNMYCNNTGAITIANESGITKGARHFRAKVYYLREVIEYGDHSEHTRNIGMLPASSLM
ncbi:zinc finger, CCHC-type containing protein [Tanacetum coccineum]